MIFIVVTILLLFVLYAGGAYKGTNNKVTLYGITKAAYCDNVIVFLDILHEFTPITNDPGRRFVSYLLDLNQYLKTKKKNAVLFVDSIYTPFREYLETANTESIARLNKLSNIKIEWGSLLSIDTHDLIREKKATDFYDKYKKHFFRIMKELILLPDNTASHVESILKEVCENDKMKYDEKDIKIFEKLFLQNTYSHRGSRLSSPVYTQMEKNGVLMISEIEKYLKRFCEKIGKNIEDFVHMHSSLYMFFRSYKYSNGYLLFITTHLSRYIMIIDIFEMLEEVKLVRIKHKNNNKYVPIEEKYLFFRGETKIEFEPVKLDLHRRRFNLVISFYCNDDMIIFVNDPKEILKMTLPESQLYMYLKELDNKTKAKVIFYYYPFNKDQNITDILDIKNSFENIEIREIINGKIEIDKNKKLLIYCSEDFAKTFMVETKLKFKKYNHFIYEDNLF